MIFSVAADGVVLFHGLFIIFVLLGGLLVLKWRAVAWLHVPAAVWGVVVEVFHLTCPLTHWENLLRLMAGQQGYTGGYVEHYLLPVIYPAGLTAGIQLVLGSVVLLINGTVYWRLCRQWRGGTKQAIP
ncbi:DUF2784 domain-containing protein [Pseudomonas silvicola]|uniref:DUF2784 domain-containing protein n=1 Tax=Pseudomonas sp. RIT-To-2 TaxID=3462541 RepID=UPI00227CB1EA|nr:DUF2784 domain-containing protein [Pseudomonas silvicola]